MQADFVTAVVWGVAMTVGLGVFSAMLALAWVWLVHLFGQSNP